MSFERFGGFESSEERAREKIVETILREPDVRPDMKAFESVYGAEVIAEDMRVTTRLREQFAAKDKENPDIQRGRKFSAAFERVFKSWSTRLGWFGDKSEVMASSEYDDYVNGVDGILALRGTEYVSLAIDTTHTGTDGIEKKMLKALDRVTGKEKPLIVKYFQRKNYRGQLTESIPVVIGLDNRDANQIIDTFGQVITLLKQKERTPRQNEILAEKVALLKKHPAQLVFLQEIREQLSMYRRVLEHKDEEKLQSTKAHVEDILRIINELTVEKSHIELGELENDRAMEAIRTFCRSQK